MARCHLGHPRRRLLGSRGSWYVNASRRCQLNRVLGVIPARLGSERLHRKPLQLLADRPLIEWVWKQVVPFEVLDHVVIATDSEGIAGICYGFGAAVEMTLVTHRSGTERCAEVAAREANADFDIVVNIQGDEPFVTEEQVSEAIRQIRAGYDIGTVAAPIHTLEAYRDPSVVKIARAETGRALYFSRAPIPHIRGGEPSEKELGSAAYLRHIGVYAYTRAALLRWVALPETELERIEKLEQLRPLAAGMSIGVAVVQEAAGGVDTREDLERAARLLKDGTAAQ
ncbi:MAG: 3-deoxy-manno-octulosonate cytidylyltransferase [Gemmatimonadota bacterium]